MNGHLNIAVLGVDISEKLVGLALLVTGASLHLTVAHLQEAGQACDGLIQVTKLIMNETDALIALGFLLLLVGTLTGLQALLEVLQGMVELLTLLEVDGNDLVHSDELF